MLSVYATEKAKNAGLSLKSTDYRQPCPQCSPNRLKKKDPCLHVTTTGREIKACCHHCGWGMIFDDDDLLGPRRSTPRTSQPRERRKTWY